MNIKKLGKGVNPKLIFKGMDIVDGDEKKENPDKIARYYDKELKREVLYYVPNKKDKER